MLVLNTKAEIMFNKQIKREMLLQSHLLDSKLRKLFNFRVPTLRVWERCSINIGKSGTRYSRGKKIAKRCSQNTKLNINISFVNEHALKFTLILSQIIDLPYPCPLNSMINFFLFHLYRPGQFFRRYTHIAYFCC